MGTQRVKAVSEVSAQSRDYYKKKNENRRQWSLRFLELLLQEYEEEQQEKERQAYGRKSGSGGESTTEEQEEDPRIVRRGEEPVPEDWDSLEISREWTCPVLTSELYVDIVDHVKRVGNWKANILYKIANTVMENYYEKAFDEQAVEELFRGCFQKCTQKNKEIAASGEKKYEILRTLYEYFARVNARKSVIRNEKEGRRLVEQCGLSWAGTTYYNSGYYFIWKRMQLLLQRVCNEISAGQGLAGISFADMERQTQFFHVGGLTFHGVFVWVQKKDNYPGNQYGMKELGKEPPEDFVYLYRNHFAKGEEAPVRLLERRLRGNGRETEKQLWRSFVIEDDREYHNGMSYLLEGSLMDEKDEALYGMTMGFLQNFRLYRVAGCVEFLHVRWKKGET